MTNKIAPQWFLPLIAVIGLADTVRADPPSGLVAGQSTAPAATNIVGLCDDRGVRIDGGSRAEGHPPNSRVGLNDTLWVVVRTSADPAAETLTVAADCTGLVTKLSTAATTSGTSAGAGLAAALVPAVPLDATQYALLVDGRVLQSPADVRYEAARHAFGYRLTRNDQNSVLWRSLLGSPTAAHRTVTIALSVRQPNGVLQPTIEGSGGSATFELRVFSWPWFWIAAGAVALMFILVVGTARQSSTLRDTLLPQLPPSEQPYSLGRCQMAFWFVLIFASFLFLYVLLWDYDTVSTQALELMGISSVTALASVAVDVYKDSPADAANRALQALGMVTHADVVRIQDELAIRQQQVKDATAQWNSKQVEADAAKATAAAVVGDPNATAEQKATAQKAANDAVTIANRSDRDLRALLAEIQDQRNMLRTYDDKVRPFRSESLFKDLTTDLNGPTVHRLQVLFWTLALGAVFLVGVYRDLSMPSFGATLLALMGLSGAGYVGFKYPEKNS